MIRKPTRQSATRLTCGVLVAAASAFTIGVGLADSASAATVTGLSINPSSASTPVSEPVTYTVTVTNSDNSLATSEPLTVTATQSVVSATNPLLLDELTQTKSGNSGNSATASTYTDSESITTGSSTSATPGKATFTLQSAAAGSVGISVKDTTNNVVQATATETVVGGNTGANAVAKVTATPTSYTGYTSAGAPTYTITTTDSSGNPVANGDDTVYYEITSGPDYNAYGGQPLVAGAVTSPNGQLQFTPTTIGSQAGTDNLTFYVNHTNAGSSSLLPDGTDPTAPVTATFTTQPTIDRSDSSVTAPSATLPAATTGTKIPFTANVVDDDGDPIQGAVVTFTASGTAFTTAPAPQTATTDADGNATVSFTTSNSTNGNSATVSAKVGSQTITSAATVAFATPAPQTPTLTPGDESVAAGAKVTETLTLTDQFGTPIPNQTGSFTVNGRNAVAATPFTTNASGQATLSYTDNSTIINASDTLTATVDGVDASATISFPSGGLTPSGLSLSGVNDTPGSVSPTSQALTATVTNTDGQPLAGIPVTFKVDQGFVSKSASTTDPAPTTTTVTVNTAANGQATANVGSETSGYQTVTVAAGSLSTTTGPIYYAADPAFMVLLRPTTASIVPGQEQKFTATVEDNYGNGIPNQSVTFTQSGPGNLSGNSSQNGTTAADGTASVTLSLPTGATVGGTGTVTVTGANTLVIPSSSATYTVQGPTPSSLTLAFGSTNVVGKKGTIAATVKNDDGSAAVGVTVHFTLAGADAVTGTAATGPNGVATFSYTPTRTGTVSASAFADTDNSGAQNGTEPTGTATASVSAAPKKVETPTITLQSHTKGWVTIKINTNPNVVNGRVWVYQVVGGKKVLKATAHTNASGNASYTFKGLKPGSTVKYTVKSPDVFFTEHFSATKSIKVKK